jgi:hypothetical protein
MPHKKSSDRQTISIALTAIFAIAAPSTSVFANGTKGATGCI